MRSHLFGPLAFLASVALLTPLWGAADADDQPPGLVCALRGHKEAVYGVAFSPDGKFVVTASGDPSVKVWNAETGKVFKTFSGPSGHKQLVLAVAVSPDGTQFATAGSDNTARVWDFPSSRHLRAYAQGGPARAVAVSADGARVAGGGADGKVKIWDTVSKKLLHEIDAHAGAVTGLAFSPNGQVLASCGGDSTLRLVNVADGKTLAHFAAHAGAVTGMAYNPGGNAVYTTGSDGTLKFWSLPPAPARTLPAFQDAVGAVAVSPDGSQAAVASGKGVRLARWNDGQTLKELPAAPGVLTCVAAAPGNALTAAGDRDGRVAVWDAKKGELLASPVGHAGAVTAVAFNGAGNQLATVGKDGFLRLWAVPPAPTRSLAQPDAVRSAAVTPDGKHLVTGGADKVIRSYRLDQPQTPPRQLSGHGSAVEAVALSPDGKVLVSAGGSGLLRFWDLGKGVQTGTVGGHAGAVTSLAFLGGSRVLSASADGSVKVFAVPPAATKNVLAHAGAVTALAASPDGTRLLTGSADQQARLWNLSTGKLERTFSGPAQGVLAVAYSPLGNRVAAGSGDKALYVWESAGGKEVKKFTHLPAAVRAVALSADGKHAAAGLADGSVRLFDLAAGKEVDVSSAHEGEVHALLFTPKGDRLISGGADGVVQTRVVFPRPAAGVRWKTGAAVLALALSKDGARLAVGGADKKITVRVLATGKDEASFATPSPVRGLSFSADGKKLAAAGGEQARVYGPGGELEEYFAHTGAVNAVAWSANGKHVFTAGADKTARVWAPALVWGARHGAAVTQAAYSPRGDRVVSAGADGLVRLWAAADGKPAQALHAHAGAVLALSVSADGARLATVGADKTARVWDLAKLAANTSPRRVGKAGKELDAAAVTLALPAAAQSVALSPNGARLAAGFPAPEEGKETVRVYDAGAGKELLDLGGLPSRVVGFLADNRTLLAAGAGQATRLVDFNLQAAFEAHPGGATAVAYHGNGTQVLTAGADKAVKLWALATGKLDRTFGPTAEGVTGAALSRDGTQAAATAGKTLTVWNVANGNQVLAVDLPAAAAGAPSFNPDRTRIAVSVLARSGNGLGARADGRVSVYDAPTGKELQGFLHAGPPVGAAFHPSQNQVISGGADKAVRIHTLSAARMVVAGTKLNGLAALPNQSQVLTAGENGKAVFYNLGNGQADRTLKVSDKPLLSAGASRNGQLIALGSADNRVHLYPANQLKALSIFTAPAQPRSLAFSGDSKVLAAACADGSLTTWDVVYSPGQPAPAEFGKVLQVFAHGPKAAAAGVAFPTTGAVFYSAGGQAVRAWKAASEAPTRTFGHPASVNALAYSPDGTQLLTGCSDGQLRLFDLAKGSLLRQIVAHKTVNRQAIYCVAFSPDGKKVVCGSVDQSLTLHDAATGKLLQEFKAYKEKAFPKGHQEAVLSVAFSPDGKQVVSGGMDKTIKVWNVADGSVARELVNPDLKPAGPGQPAPAHPGWVYAVRYYDGGKKILSAGGAPRLRGYLATWDAGAGKRLFGKEMAAGTLFAAAVSADGSRVALGAGGSLRSGPDLNQALVIHMPKGQ
jgi:WD40 repeat protein